MSKRRAIVFLAASKPRRVEDWSPEDRLRVVAEAAKLSEDDLGSFLRREGLHEATLREWRSAAHARAWLRCATDPALAGETRLDDDKEQPRTLSRLTFESFRTSPRARA